VVRVPLIALGHDGILGGNDDRSWHKADIAAVLSDVCFRTHCGHGNAMAPELAIADGAPCGPVPWAVANAALYFGPGAAGAAA
jgi:hypothetical protein